MKQAKACFFWGKPAHRTLYAAEGRETRQSFRNFRCYCVSGEKRRVRASLLFFRARQNGGCEIKPGRREKITPFIL